MSLVSLHNITIPVYIRNLLCLKNCLEKAQKWCHENEKPETHVTEGRLAPDMLPLPFQIQLCTLMVRSGVFGKNWAFHSPADEPEYEQDFPGMISRIQKTVDYLQTVKPGDEGDAESRPYSYWPSGKEGEGDPIVFASASNLLMQHRGVPLAKLDFLLSAGMFY